MGKKLLLLATALMIGVVASYAQMSSKEIEKLAAEYEAENGPLTPAVPHGRNI